MVREDTHEALKARKIEGLIQQLKSKQKNEVNVLRQKAEQAIKEKAKGR